MIGLRGEDAGSAEAWKGQDASAVAANTCRRDIQIFGQVIGRNFSPKTGPRQCRVADRTGYKRNGPSRSAHFAKFSFGSWSCENMFARGTDRTEFHHIAIRAATISQ